VLGSVFVSNVQADPSDDAVAKLNDLSRQAEQTTEAMHTAQLDLAKKLVALREADSKHARDVADAETSKAQLATFQTAVDKLAAAQYMGGRTDSLNAILTADSPQQLIDGLAVQRMMAAEMAAQMKNYQRVSTQATQAEHASAKSAADAKTAAEQATAVRADLQSKQSKLQTQIAIVKSQFNDLSTAQRAALAAPPPVPAVLHVAMPAPDALPPAPPPDLAPPAAPGLPDFALPGLPDPNVPGLPGLPGDPLLAAAAPGLGDVTDPDGAVHGPRGGSEGAIAVQAALTRIGSPYSWGAAGPSAFDCSGLVMWSFQQAGISLPHSSQALAAGGQPVALSDMQPGDVVTYYSDASHAAIYIGDGMMVHASTYGTPVRVAPVNNAPIYDVRRY
jgi:cell wall-associated NlpC family hydrolase